MHRNALTRNPVHHWIALDRCFGPEERTLALAYVTGKVYADTGRRPWPAEVEEVVVDCPCGESCTEWQPDGEVIEVDVPRWAVRDSGDDRLAMPVSALRRVG